MNSSANAYDALQKQAANYVPLSPLSFLERAAKVYPERAAVVHGERRYGWAETYGRARQLASALAAIGIGAGDTVAAMCANTPELYEAHFGVPMAGAVLNALNVRLDAKMIAFILEHGDAKVLLTDKEFSPAIKEALSLTAAAPVVIDIDDALAGGGELLGGAGEISGQVAGISLPLRVVEALRGVGGALRLQQAHALLVRTQPKVLQGQGAGWWRQDHQQRQAEQPAAPSRARREQQQGKQQPVALIQPGIELGGVGLVQQLAVAFQQALNACLAHGCAVNK